MKGNLVRRVLILGSLTIIGIVAIQAYWLLKTYDLKDKEFDQSVRIALRNVAALLAEYNDTDIPRKDLINRQSSNYYVVNYNNYIDANLLENYLYESMTALHLNTDFEYAVFDCFSKDLVYGNYCRLEDKEPTKRSTFSPVAHDIDYYFVVKFPSRESYLLSNMATTLMFFLIAAVSVLFFTYSLLVIIKQQRLSELQRDFINNMTHEFKTPISSIKIAADVVAKHAIDVDNPRIQKYADVIRTQNNRLNSQVEKVLNIAKVEDGTFSIKKEEFDLSSLVSDIVNNESIKLSEGTITMVIPETPKLISADRLHLTNVIYNLIDNGIKYSDDTPSITVEVRDQGKETTLSISDEGVGISKDNQKAIFEKFYRVPTGNVHNVKGFGLGLFYVKNICKSHGWKVQLKSQEGQGTTVTITIPNTK